jgi:cytochrome c oxidase subunit 3
VLKHHFDNLHQQHAAERLGMWMFLATEVLFFGGIFGAYTVYRLFYPTEFEQGSSHLNRTIATINTLFLITSSLTMTLAIRSARFGDRGGLARNLWLTFALGAAFMVGKGIEYTQDFEEQYVPGVLFQREYARAAARLAEAEAEATATLTHAQAEEALNKVIPGQPPLQRWSREMALNNLGKNAGDPGYINPDRVQLFLLFYYIMTGIHGIHILVGLGCILWLVLENYRGMIPPANYSTVEVVSLYWHLVDAIWLFLMPLLYLAGAGLHH